MPSGIEYVRSADVAGLVNVWLDEDDSRSVRDIAKSSGLETKTVSAVYGQQRPLVSLFLADKILVAIGSHLEDLSVIVKKERKGVLSSPGETDVLETLREDIKAFGWRLRLIQPGDSPGHNDPARIDVWIEHSKSTICVSAPDQCERYDIAWLVARTFAVLQGFPKNDGSLAPDALADAWAYSYMRRLGQQDRAKKQLQRISRRISMAQSKSADMEKIAYAVWPILVVTPGEERGNIISWFREFDSKIATRIEEIAEGWGWKAPTKAEEAWELLQNSPL